MKKIALKKQKWDVICAANKNPPSFQRWTDEDDAGLENNKNWSIDLEDTAYGRLVETNKRECIASVYVMSKEEMDAMRVELDQAEEAQQEQENVVQQFNVFSLHFFYMVKV